MRLQTPQLIPAVAPWVASPVDISLKLTWPDQWCSEKLIVYFHLTSIMDQWIGQTQYTTHYKIFLIEKMYLWLKPVVLEKWSNKKLVILEA